MDKDIIKTQLDVVDAAVAAIRAELAVIDDDDQQPPPPPPPPPPVDGYFMRGHLPADGFLDSSNKAPWIRPKVREGARLTGTVEIQVEGNVDPPVPVRLLVDGVPQDSFVIDTTDYSDGTHVLGVQVTDAEGRFVSNGSRVVIFNNSGQPVQSKEAQAVVAHSWNGITANSLAWGRVNVVDPTPFPLDPQLDKHPEATSVQDQQRLATERIWWVEGINHIPTPLWQCLPMLCKNNDGDYFIKQWNPQAGGAGTWAKYAQPYVEAAPAFDGPRGVGNISPYASINPDRYYTWPDGTTGWIGVDKSGRVFRLSITGEVVTLLGPRSVAGEVQTDPDSLKFTLDDRLSAGEKEYIGDDNGKRLNLPHDIWVCDSFPFEGVVADQLNDSVTEIHFEQQRLMRRWTVPGVTSVWGSYTLQQDHRIAWVAAAPDGLWCQQINVDEQGEPVGHGEVRLEKSIPKAFWVRAHENKAYVLTLELRLVEYDFDTGKLRELRAGTDGFDARYCFMQVDELGCIGPAGRIYWSYTMAKTSVKWIDPDTLEEGHIDPSQLINKRVYGNWLADRDSFGHYLWGFSIHGTMPKMLGCGISSSGWFMWTGCLGEVPEPEPAIPYDGTEQWRNGELDKWLAPAAVYGYNGHGWLGYSADQFRDYETWDDAKPSVMEALAPMFPDDVTAAVREAVGRQLFTQRTRSPIRSMMTRRSIRLSSRSVCATRSARFPRTRMASTAKS